MNWDATVVDVSCKPDLLGGAKKLFASCPGSNTHRVLVACPAKDPSQNAPFM